MGFFKEGEGAGPDRDRVQGRRHGPARPGHRHDDQQQPADQDDVPHRAARRRRGLRPEEDDDGLARRDPPPGRPLPGLVRRRDPDSWAYATIADDSGREMLRQQFGAKAEGMVGMGAPAAPPSQGQDTVAALAQLADLLKQGLHHAGRVRVAEEQAPRRLTPAKHQPSLAEHRRRAVHCPGPVAGSSNGRTPDSGSGSRGSSPCPAASRKPRLQAGFLLSRWLRRERLPGPPVVCAHSCPIGSPDQRVHASARVALALHHLRVDLQRQCAARRGPSAP